MSRKPSRFDQNLIIAILILLAFYSFVSTLLTRNITCKLDLANLPVKIHHQDQDSLTKVKVFMYNLPPRFNYGIVDQYSMARGILEESASGLPSLNYPDHQHMAEWYLFTDMTRPESERVGSPVVRVLDPDEADLFYVPVFSSLSLLVNPSQNASGTSWLYSDEKMQEGLVEWLDGQEYWSRNNGRDHIFVAQDPNALNKVMDKIKTSILLVSDFGRLRADQASLVKDVILPYSPRITTYDGSVGIENRNTLLFFMGNRYRKEGGKIRDLLFQILENERDVIIKQGTQTPKDRQTATQGMHTSKFCLHPAGDTPSSCRLFDAIVSMCIPVIVSDGIELPFEDVIYYRKFAVFVDTATALKPGRLVRLLRKASAETIMEYQRELQEVKRYFLYDNPNGPVNEIWRQVTKKLPFIKLMINRDKRLVKKIISVNKRVQHILQKHPMIASMTSLEKWHLMRGLPEPDCSCLCTNQTGITSSL